MSTAVEYFCGVTPWGTTMECYGVLLWRTTMEFCGEPSWSTVE